MTRTMAVCVREKSESRCAQPTFTLIGNVYSTGKSRTAVPGVKRTEDGRKLA